MELLEFGYRIGAALLAGLFIGIEREIQNKNAGIRDKCDWFHLVLPFLFYILTFFRR